METHQLVTGFICGGHPANAWKRPTKEAKLSQLWKCVNGFVSLQLNCQRIKSIKHKSRNQSVRIHLRNGKYGLVEVKLGGDRLINEGAANLLALAGKINTEKRNEPSFMMVLTGTGNYAYRRKDGVYVVPVGCLKD